MPRKQPQQKPHRSEQSVETPAEFIDAVQAVWGRFDRDACATGANKQAAQCFTIDDDALTSPWVDLGLTWCNPPYGTIMPFVERAGAGRTNGTRTLMLVPASTGAEWFRLALSDADCYLLHPRLTFVGHTSPYPKDLALFDFWQLGGGKIKPWRWK